jgi:hypothetical protein
MRARERYQALVRDTANRLAFAIGLLSAIAQLVGISNRVGRILVILVFVSCFFFLVVRFTVTYYVKSISDLRQRLIVLQLAHKNFVEAINRVIDQEGPIYGEILILTVTIGENNDADTIEEERVTTPRPRVTQRAIQPIVPANAGSIIGIDELELTATVDGRAGRITVLPITTHQKPRVWLVFPSGLTDTFTWRIKYRPRGLWAPLRENGSDTLAWNDRLVAGNGGNSLLQKLVVRFVFTTATQEPQVSELHDIGEVTGVQGLTGNRGWVVEWQDTNPAGKRYEWNLAQTVQALASVPAQSGPSTVDSGSGGGVA